VFFLFVVLLSGCGCVGWGVDELVVGVEVVC